MTSPELTLDAAMVSDFGARLGQQFTRARIERMMTAASLIDIRAPYGCAVGAKA